MRSLNSSSPTKGFHLALLQPALAWIAILGLVFFSALCILVHAGGILRWAFPLGTFAVGVFLYLRYPILYLGFTWWIWFLTPWVRRLVDYQSGWVDPSPVLLAPPLVTLVTFATFVRYLPKSYYQGSLPFILCSVGVFYGFLSGLIQNSNRDALLSLLEWLTPILFGFHLFVNWRDYPSYRQNTQRVFLWGVLVMGTYGICQYLVAPEWDRFWLNNAVLASPTFGTPEPLGIRVWSTMNSPQPFACVMMAGLLLLFSTQGNLRFPAAGAGYLAFLLSSARSAWLSWLVALLVFMPSLKARLQMRLIISIMVAAVFVLPLANIEPFSTAITPRLESLSNVKKDSSYNARSEGYSELLSLALSEPLGKGLGSTVSSDSIGSRDSGILSMLFSLGWFGTIPYLGGIILLFFKLFQGSEGRVDSFASATRAIAVGTFAQIGLNVVMVGVNGIVLWGFLGMSMAAHKYYWHQKTTSLGRG